MINKTKNVPFDSKQTEMIGNVQLGQYYTDDIVQIRKDFDNLFSSFDFRFVDSYYFIVHDTNNGLDSEYIHVHFILLLKGQVRLNTVCNRIAEGLNVSPLAISITVLISIVGALKYWLHITEESKEDGKKEYQPYEIISNESDLIIEGYLESESKDNVSIRLIKQLVVECELKSDVLLKLNNDRLIRKNRYYIDTLWNDKSLLQLRQNDLDNLPFSN